MNSNQWAPATILCPGRIHVIDYSVFKKIPGEEDQLYNMKQSNKEERRAVYGTRYKKFLNIPSRSLGSKVVNSF